MSRFEIRLAHRGRDTPLDEAGFLARKLGDPDDRATTRAIVMMALESGERTTGQLLDRLERMSEPERHWRRCGILADLTAPAPLHPPSAPAHPPQTPSEPVVD